MVTIIIGIIVTIISIILLVVLSIILLLLYRNQKKKLKKEFVENCQVLFEQELEKNRQKIEEEVEEYKRGALERCHQWRDAQIAEREKVEQSLTERKQAVEEIIQQLESRRREAERNYNEIINNEKERINAELEFYRKNKIDGIESKVQFEFAEKNAAEIAAFDAKITQEQKNGYKAQLDAVVKQFQKALETYR